MALIKCPECGKEISDTTKNCIHCGYVLKEENNLTQPQTVVIAPEKGKSSKKSLNIGVTIILTVMSISLIAYSFTMSLHIFGEEVEEFYSFLGISLYYSIASIVMSILIFAVPKLRKKWFEIIYIIVSSIAIPISLTLGLFCFPAFCAFVAGIVFIIKSIIIKE